MKEYSKPLISIAEARKILASDATELTDEQIAREVQNIEALAEYLLRKAPVR